MHKLTLFAETRTKSRVHVYGEEWQGKVIPTVNSHEFNSNVEHYAVDITIKIPVQNFTTIQFRDTNA